MSTINSKKRKGMTMEMTMTAVIPTESEVDSALVTIESLSEDEVGLILSFTDFPTAARTALTVSKSWRERLLQKDSFQHVWKNMYHQQHFSTEQLVNNSFTSRTPVDYIQHARSRRQLLLNLIQKKSKQPANPNPLPNHMLRTSCFTLPNRFFSFLPVTPIEDQMFDWEDPPPVNFDCDSFMLTSSGVSGEMLMLDPFSGVVSVYENVLEKAVQTDEGMMEQAMLEAASLIEDASSYRRPAASSLPSMTTTTLGTPDHPYHNLHPPHQMQDEEHDLVADAFDNRVFQNHYMDPYHTAQRQVLIDAQDYFDIELGDYFERRPGGNNNNDNENEAPEEVEVNYLGTEAKTILQGNGVVTGTMVAVGRALSNDPLSEERSLRCVELLAWFRYTNNDPSHPNNNNSNNNTYGDRHVCRFPSGFHSIGICAVNRRVYVGFRTGDGPALPGMDVDMRVNNNNNNNNNNNDDNNEGNAGLGRSTIVVYPLVPFIPKEATDASRPSHSTPIYFPDPVLLIQCGESTSAIAVSATGDELLVGTANCRFQVWDIGFDGSSNDSAPAAKRVETLDLKACLRAALKSIRPSGYDGEPSLNESPIRDFHVPRHLSIATCGFVTAQHNRNDGTTVVLWRKGDSGGYEAQSMISLPLSARRLPKIHYDGRRLIVFGQDFIGMIILVYHVLNTNEDMAVFQAAKDDSSGGVTNFTNPPRIRFANRIRNAALGGMKYLHHIHMACNERFIVINTKTGNLSSGNSVPYAEGLLVIDLEDHA
jgi:hypothetical protein